MVSFWSVCFLRIEGSFPTRAIGPVLFVLEPNRHPSKQLTPSTSAVKQLPGEFRRPLRVRMAGQKVVKPAYYYSNELSSFVCLAKMGLLLKKQDLCI